MPQPMAIPAHDPSTGMTTAASDGPSFATPTSGLTTLPPCTSWSYWRVTHSFEQTEYDERMARSAELGAGSAEPEDRAAGCRFSFRVPHSAFRVTTGRP